MPFKPIPVTNRCITQPFVVVGCIIKKDDKFLLVQEAQVAKGKWNQPAGWLDLGEKIADGAKREAEEETGLKIKVTGFLGVYSLIKQENDRLKHPAGIKQPIKLIFAAEPLTEEIKFDPDELLAAKWFTLAEIKSLGHNLRDQDIVLEIEDYLAGKIYPLELANNFRNELDE